MPLVSPYTPRSLAGAVLFLLFPLGTVIFWPLSLLLSSLIYSLSPSSQLSSLPSFMIDFLISLFVLLLLRVISYKILFFFFFKGYFVSSSLYGLALLISFTLYNTLVWVGLYFTIFHSHLSSINRPRCVLGYRRDNMGGRETPFKINILHVLQNKKKKAVRQNEYFHEKTRDQTSRVITGEWSVS